MLLSVCTVALCALSFTTTSAYRSSSQAPECVSSCWSNSQYVSTCLGDTRCLCDDAEFQNAVYQCLYSQCSTSKFGVALHHALGYCAGSQTQPNSSSAILPAASPLPTSIQQPALLKQEGVKRRNVGAMLSNSVTRTSTRTKPTQSVPNSVYNTYSTQRAITKTLVSVGSAPTPSAYGTTEMLDGEVVGSAHHKHRHANGKVADKHHKNNHHPHGKRTDDL